MQNEIGNRIIRPESYGTHSPSSSSSSRTYRSGSRSQTPCTEPLSPLRRIASYDEEENYYSDHIDDAVSQQATVDNVTKFAFGSFLFSLLLGTALLIYKDYGIPSSVSDFLSGAIAVGEKKSESTSSTKSFTMSRVGYQPLPYFKPAAIARMAADSGSISPLLKYTFLQNYAGIVEPSASMHLVVYDTSTLGSDTTSSSPTSTTTTTSSTSSSVASSSKYHFTVCPSDETQPCESGLKNDETPTLASAITVTCSPHEVLTLTVTELLADGTKVQYPSTNLVCMYVRREIRSLSDDDLATLMDSMHQLWALDDVTGQELYGTNFRSASYLTALHQFNADGQDADHINEGNGFLAQHIKFSNMFDASLRTVNAATTLPYWDFTIDSASNQAIYESPVMSSNMFGTMTQPKHVSWGYTYANDDIERAAIPDGRWAQLKADTNPLLSELRSGHGYTRAPWNMNPSPYVSRFTSKLTQSELPTCAAHLSILESSSFDSFLQEIEEKAYGSMPSVIGGVYGCDQLIPMQGKGYLSSESDTKAVCGKWETYLKELYRLDLINFKHESDRCQITCSGSKKDALRMALATRLADHVPEDMNDKGWDAWMDFVCDGAGANIFPGDYLGPAAPSDPSFWVVHPTLERLLQAKFMAGGFETEEWPTDTTNEHVCNTAQCFDSEKGMVDYYEDCCYGHRGTDQLLDLDATRSTVFGPTNIDMIAATDPRLATYSMPYVYDGFSWTHCEEDDFKDSLKKLFSASQAPSASLFTPLGGVSTTNSPAPLRSSRPDQIASMPASVISGKTSTSSSSSSSISGGSTTGSGSSSSSSQSGGVLSLFEFVGQSFNSAATSALDLFELIGRTSATTTSSTITTAPAVSSVSSSSVDTTLENVPELAATEDTEDTAAEEATAAAATVALSPDDFAASLKSKIEMARGSVLGFPTYKPSYMPTLEPTKVPSSKPSTAFPTKVNSALSLAQILSGAVTQTVVEQVESEEKETTKEATIAAAQEAKLSAKEARDEAASAVSAALNTVLSAISGGDSTTTASASTTGTTADGNTDVNVVGQFNVASTDSVAIGTSDSTDAALMLSSASTDGSSASASAGASTTKPAKGPATTTTATTAGTSSDTIPDIGANVDTSTSTKGGGGGGGGGGGKSKISTSLTTGAGGEADSHTATNAAKTTTATTQTFYFTTNGVADSAEAAKAADAATEAATQAILQSALDKAISDKDEADAQAALERLGGGTTAVGGTTSWALLPLKSDVSTPNSNTFSDIDAPSAEDRMKELSWLIGRKQRHLKTTAQR